jgi:nucleoid DNA-binding protein
VEFVRHVCRLPFRTQQDAYQNFRTNANAVELILGGSFQGDRHGPVRPILRFSLRYTGLVTKTQLIDAVANTSGHTKKDLEVVIDAVLEQVGETLAKGEKVDLRGFGSFVAREKKARQGRNPKTGETIEIAARKAVAFKPSKELAGKVNV